tara:strand:+ start:275 stop:988 length:714 start_codon:yes stop_codon:yes gene_type:complete
MAHYVIILGAGKGKRINNQLIPKQFLELENLPIIMHSIYVFSQSNSKIIFYIGLPKKHIKLWSILCEKYNFNIKHNVFVGGEERINTVSIGLNFIKKQNIIHDTDIVSIHDSARPFIKKSFVSRLIEETLKKGSAIPVIKLKNALKQSHCHVDRSKYTLAQTPQCFIFNDILKAYITLFDSTINNIASYHDDASVYELLNKNKKLNLVQGEEYNIKITTDLDYFISEKVYEFYKKIT